MIPPLEFLALMVAASGLAWGIYLVHRARRRQLLRRLANGWAMRYAEADLFNLRDRIVGNLPVPEATQLRVLDLIYATVGDRHRYLFTAEYTCGRSDQYRRQQRVITFCDPRESSLPCIPSTMLAAPEELPVLEQYRHLKAQIDKLAPEVA
jgi:hypothetical protein